MADVKVSFEGWDSITQSWGNGGWGQDVVFTGLTGSVGSVTVAQGSGVTVTATGVAGTSAVGSVTIGEGTGVTVTVTGNSVTATAGNTTETAGGGLSIGVTGVSVTVLSGETNIWSVVDTSQTPPVRWVAVSTSQTPTWTEIAA